MMKFVAGYSEQESEIAALFEAVFTASEGAEEGAVIGAFVRDMMAATPPDDLVVWSAVEGGERLGCIFLSRLRYPEDRRDVFILSPVAVKTARQKTGVGQRLIAHGLADLRARGVAFVTTYGDPAYYGRAGFGQITQDVARAPLPLSMPEGWLGQWLSGAEGAPLKGAAVCVPALNKPEMW